jgi:serine/threonine protein phosphatase PrpC
LVAERIFCARNEDFLGATIPEGAQLTHKGIVLAIADGMSGSDAGHEASRCCIVTEPIDILSVCVVIISHWFMLGLNEKITEFIEIKINPCRIQDCHPTRKNKKFNNSALIFSTNILILKFMTDYDHTHT